MNNGVGDAKAQVVGSQNAVPNQQAPKRMGQRPQRFLKPYVRDERDEEKRDKHYQQGHKKKFVKKVYKAEKESALWLEHVLLLRAAGVDVYANDAQWRRRLQ